MIEARGLIKEYPMGKHNVRALNGVDIAIERGEFVSIIGPSGSGKSTLMHILGCLDTPTNGEYFLDGEKVSELPKKRLAAIRNRKVGFVFQTFNLLPHLNIQNNVEIPLIYAGVSKKERIEKSIGVLERVGLGDRLRHKPSELSGGQRQRVAIARALVTDPAIILADEPTGNLDSTSGGDILSMITDLHQLGNTIVMVTHDLNIAKKANRMIKIIDGLIPEDGTIA
ncbi:MAG: ABC transporter ATP-binding protein [Candidatus Cloacimonetes bacterium]|nr:ABC transporter ATP-binding protein [Candidatus Cloacimonadota bacterium]